MRVLPIYGTQFHTKAVSLCHIEKIEQDAGLFLDLAAYSIITEDNAGQYYPDYAYNHALFTDDMRIYSDSKVSDFIQGVTIDQRIQFLNEWNAKRDHREKIYISYDATNKKSQAGDIDMIEMGHSKNGIEEEIFNYSIAYDRTNREPLFYEDYPGSIPDTSQLRHTLAKAKGYGYEHVGFILDRGYFGKENIEFMDEHGYDFVIMVKGMKAFVSEIILDIKGSFEDDRRNSIRSFKVSGTTVKRKLYATDKKDRYFHIYYDDGRKARERDEFEGKIDRMHRKLKECMGEPIRPGGDYKKYFDLIYWHEGQADEKFMSSVERIDIINRDISLCGYFAIVTSEKMTAEEALLLYKSRDESEKTFLTILKSVVYAFAGSPLSLIITLFLVPKVANKTSISVIKPSTQSDLNSLILFRMDIILLKGLKSSNPSFCLTFSIMIF